MAEHRMFSPKIVCSDAFMGMPLSAQALYFLLGVHAYDKGIIYDIHHFTYSVGASPEDIQTLLDKHYLRGKDDHYEIVHWYENNGIGETARKRNNYQYRKWRQAIIDRDKVCQECGADKNLEVHHIKHFAEHPELRLSDDNAIVLCRSCHRKLHRRERNG